MTRVGAALPVAAIAVLALAASSWLGAQEQAEKQAAPYRRIFVPHSELSSLVRGLLPMKRSEFDRRIEAAFHPLRAEASLGPRIASAQYTARFAGESLEEGQVRFDIAAPAGASGPMSLEPCNLALGAGTWEETPPRQAILGIGPRNVLTLQVDKSGTLVLPWSRRGQSAPDGAVAFELLLPPASLHTLRLTLPADRRLTASAGLVAAGQPGDDGTREWTVELGGIGSTTLRIESESQAASPQRLTLFKEQARYALTPTDVSAEFQFQLDVHGAGLNAAQFQIDPRLNISTVVVGGRPAAWSVEGDAKSRTLSVQLPETLSAGSHTITIQSVAQTAAGRPWRLPRIRWPQGVWQEGSATLVVSPAVQLAVSRTSGCHMAKGSPSPGAIENLDFQYYSVDGFVEVAMLPRRPRLTAAMGVSVQFDPAVQVSATLRADLTSQDGEAFEVDAVFSNDWVLDAMETEPPDLLEDRPVIAQDERQRTMRLKFLRPITPDSPLRLIVRARLQQPSTLEFSANSLWRWFRLPGTIERPAVLAVRNNVANYDLQVIGDGDATRLDSESASSDELALLDSPSSALLFRLPSEASEFRVLLREGDPRYAAAWDLTAACSRNRIRHQATVRCTPSGPGVSRLTVQSVPPPDREIRWRIADGTDTAVVAQTRRDTPAAAGVPAAAEWELEFSRPLTQPFTLESNWESIRSARQSVALFTCVKATSQTCLVRVAAEDDARWFLAARGLTALPIPPQTRDRFSQERGRFRYEAQRQASLAIVEYGQEAVVPLAWTTSAELTSRFAADGSALSTLSLALVNEGLAELPIDLPPTASLREVAVDRVAVEPQSAGVRNSLRIPLPDRVRNVTVRVVYATAAQRRPFYADKWRTELPQLAMAPPPLVWHVVLPPGVRALDDVQRLPWHEQLIARFWTPMLPEGSWLRWLHPWCHAGAASALHAADSAARPGGGEAADGLALPTGWSHVSRDAVWSPEVTTLVYQPGRWSLIGLSLALLASGLALVTPRRWISFWFLSAIVLAAAIMVLPLVAASFLSGAFWGLVVGCCASLLRPQAIASQPRLPPPPSTMRGMAAAGATAGLLLAWLLSAGGAALQAQPPDRPAPPLNAAQTHRVVIPIDDERKPVGEYVFVNAEFYDWLHEGAEGGQPVEPWRIEEAIYEIRWPEESRGEVPAVDVMARLEITTLAVDASVVLPFRRQDVLLKQGAARLDGTPLAVAWQDDGQGLTASIPSPGSYRLELAFSAPLKAVGRYRELSLAMPRAPHAVARVSGVPAAAAITAPTALGSATTEDAASLPLQIDFGSAGELALRSAGEDAAGEQQAMEAEQLLSWKIRPGSVVVDAVCKFRALGGMLRGVQVRFDPRLRLLPLEGLPPGARQWVESGTENTLQVALAEPTAAISIRPRFLLPEASGFGKIVPPRVQAVAGRMSRSWLAVTTGTGVELAAIPQAAAKVPLADFAQAFGTMEGIPAAAFDLAGLSAAPEFELRPADHAAVASAETTVLCGQSLCRLTFHAELTGLMPAHVQQRIVLPPGWTAADVGARDGDLPLACRWFQQADGTVVVRLDQSPGSSLQLRVEATHSPAAGAPLILPEVRLLDVSVAAHALRVERMYDCSVEMREVSGWTADGLADAGQAAEGRRRVVASLKSAPVPGSRQLTMQIQPNRPQVAARLLTRYSRPGLAQAAASLVCDLEIAGGSLDELRLEAPPEWSGPWETDPALAVRAVDIPGPFRRFVTLTPDRPLTGKVRLSITSPFHQAAGEPPRIPEFNLVDVQRVVRLVQLPKVESQDASRWVTTFLQAEPLPADLQGQFPNQEEFDTLLVTGPHFSAALSTTPTSAATPLVSLIAYRVQWLPTGAVRGTAMIHLDPAGRDSFVLALDDGYLPLAITMDGIPAEASRQEGGRWLVRLPGDRLPQWMTVEYACPPAIEAEAWSDRRHLRLSGPTLVGLAASRTIWSVQSPPALDAHAPGLSAETDLARVDQDLARLASADEMLVRANERESGGLVGEALTTWLSPWRADVEAASRRVEGVLRTLVVDDGERQDRLRLLQTAIDQHMKEFPDTDDRADVSPGTESAPPASGRLAGTFVGPVPTVELWFSDATARQPQRRWAAAVGVLVLGAAAWFLARLAAVRDWVAASSPFAVALAGVALASLSPLGLAALAFPAAVLASAWRSPWPLRTGGGHSSVMRLDRRRAG